MHRIAADPQHRLWRATPVGLARFDGHQDLQAARDALQRLSPSDVLTRIDNRRHFQREFDQATVMSQRLAVPVALLLTDIDRFKAVKDRYGHLQGDACLPAVPRVLPSTVRVGKTPWPATPAKSLRCRWSAAAPPLPGPRPSASAPA